MIKYFVIRSFRGTCSSVEMVKGTCLSVELLKGYMVKERLVTPALDSGENLSHSYCCKKCAQTFRIA